jgi:hypothetical protein
VTSLLEARGSDAIEDAPRGPALWEARQNVAARLVNPLLATLLLAPFWGVALWMLRNPHPEAMHMRLRLAGVDVPLDAQGQMEAYYAFIVVLLSFVVPAMVNAALRAWRMWYRVDGLAVETWRGTRMVRRIGIGEIRSVAVHASLAWMRVRVGRSRRGGMEMRLRAEDATRLLAVLDSLGIEEDEIVAPIGIVALAPEEPVRWRGRAGLGSFDASRAIIAVALGLPPLIFALILHSIWSGGPDLLSGLVLSGVAFVLIGGPVLAAAAAFGAQFGIWFNDAFGTILVTDRRIAWRAALSDKIYREIALADLVDAVIVEQKGSRAWVGLTVRHRKDVRDEDMRGVPDADGFIAALGLAAR